MANIISITFFEGGELNIAGTETTPVQERVAKLISKYEPLFLQKALGYPLWKLLKDNGYPTPPAGRFKDLIDGNVEYVDRNGNTQNWIGLKDTYQSPIAAYVWYYYQRHIATNTTVTGESKGKTENAGNVDVMTKQMRAWNEMSRIVSCELWEYLLYAKNGSNERIYPEFKLSDAKYFGVLNTANL